MEKRNIYRVSVGEPEGKKQLASPRCRWEDNSQINLQEVGCGVWTRVSYLRKGTGGGHF
jgi:hypothetical protein